MSVDVLMHRYRELRAELDRAYGEPEWNTERIDAIADALTPLERELAAKGATEFGDLGAA